MECLPEKLNTCWSEGLLVNKLNNYYSDALMLNACQCSKAPMDVAEYSPVRRNAYCQHFLLREYIFTTSRIFIDGRNIYLATSTSRRGIITRGGNARE